MEKQHHYHATITWTGNQGSGTSSYRAYSRDHEISAPGKPVILASSDPAFHGDPARYNPEDLLVASLSECHMLWYLSLCARNRVIVLDYRDNALGTMEESADGGGKFVEVILHPVITLTPGSNVDLARELHHEAHQNCFVANSVNFPVRCEPVFRVQGQVQ